MPVVSRASVEGEAEMPIGKRIRDGCLMSLVASALAATVLP